ncbi:MAG: DUF5110 domain-containing protein [Phycisphaerales bacterium]
MNGAAFDLVDEAGNRSLPTLKIRPGAIVPLGPVIEWTSEKPLDPLTLLINLDNSGRASGTLYEDAGDGYGYLQGEYLSTTFYAEIRGDAVEVSIAKTEGNMPRPKRAVSVTLMTEKGRFTGTLIDGQKALVPIK